MVRRAVTLVALPRPYRQDCCWLYDCVVLAGYCAQHRRGCAITGSDDLVCCKSARYYYYLFVSLVYRSDTFGGNVHTSINLYILYNSVLCVLDLTSLYFCTYYDDGRLILLRDMNRAYTNHVTTRR